MKPGCYDLVNFAGNGETSLKAIKVAKPIGVLTSADIRSGHIAIYLIRKPGK
jgi:hypothetical protein